ncbi:hypothetical protein [Hufsiella ginkgonis]|uniref:DUF3575 domain-containing protein n=1 Tax=Hufsiella ginkgonis TaxID=2695274 RepID=A0A7K1XWC7_9SPHI|nr:hypothetical protein [Hufsiella ginkgonis]MXV14816.1 hypothetical protein [Hufsiella ginkgonis]
MKLLVTLALSLVVACTYAQDTDTVLVYLQVKPQSALTLGYNYSFAEPNERNFHLAEVRVERGRTDPRHGGFGVLSLGTDIGLNTRKFLAGPRAGVLAGFMGICLGADLDYYTDFEQGTLRLVPIIGIGSNRIRLSINPHVRLTNRYFEPIDRGHINLTVRLLTLRR